MSQSFNPEPSTSCFKPINWPYCIVSHPKAEKYATKRQMRLSHVAKALSMQCLLEMHKNKPWMLLRKTMPKNEANKPLKIPATTPINAYRSICLESTL